jgi:hypothetical protein
MESLSWILRTRILFWPRSTRIIRGSGAPRKTKKNFETDLETAIRRNSALPLDPDIVVCLETGWTWAELQATPGWVVADVKTYLHKRALIAKQRRKMAQNRG